MQHLSTAQLTALLVCAAVAPALFYEAPLLVRILVNAEEEIVYSLAPSPERAFAYGERHFSASNQALYDIDRAEWYFDQAAAATSTIPYLYHERARISFLRGDFHNALARINLQISLQGDKTPNSYYVRGLIEGFMGDYEAAAKDYEYYLSFHPNDWAANNDYAWVLLKAERYTDALKVTNRSIEAAPENPWLLNSNAIALYELGRYDEALAIVERAIVAVDSVTPEIWSRSYPGNDPAVAPEGVKTFQQSVGYNFKRIEAAIASSTKTY